jgi:hypothetical protein
MEVKRNREMRKKEEMKRNTEKLKKERNCKQLHSSSSIPYSSFCPLVVIVLPRECKRRGRRGRRGG